MIPGKWPRRLLIPGSFGCVICALTVRCMSTLRNPLLRSTSTLGGFREASPVSMKDGKICRRARFTHDRHDILRGEYWILCPLIRLIEGTKLALIASDPFEWTLALLPMPS